MRILVAWFALLALTQTCPAADNDRPDLKSLYDARRWFELRNSVAKGAAPVFYQGAVACSFNDVHRCDKKLGAVIKSRPRSDEAVEAHRVLASVYLRQGKYREALAQVDAVLALRPGDSDAGDVRPLLTTLSEFPDQEVVRRPSTTLKLHDEGLPISINGVQGTYWFDTGANYSILTATRESTRAPVLTPILDDTARTANPKRLASDSYGVRWPDPDCRQGSRGLIGIPVLLAFQRFVWGSDRKFEIDSKSVRKHVPHADLCFDGNTPVTQIQFENRSLAFVLDTGATNTDLYPPFAAAFPDLIRTPAKTDSYKTEGVGSVKYMDAARAFAGLRTTGNPPMLKCSEARVGRKWNRVTVVNCSA